MPSLRTSKKKISRVVGTDHNDPFEVLGMHPVWSYGGQHLVVRRFRPEARSVHLMNAAIADLLTEMGRRHDDGYFEQVVVPDRTVAFAHDLQMTNDENYVYTLQDLFRSSPVLTDFGLRLIGAGSHQKLFDRRASIKAKHSESFSLSGRRRYDA